MMKVYEVIGLTGMCKEQWFTTYFDTEENARKYMNKDKWPVYLWFKEKTIAPNENGEIVVIEEKKLEIINKKVEED